MTDDEWNDYLTLFKWKQDYQGPWSSEPDTWEQGPITNSRGFHLLALRFTISGAWNGYVGIPRGNIWYRCGSNSACQIISYPEITYAGNGLVGGLKDFWYLGFDHGHYGDFQPGLKLTMNRYRIVKERELPQTLEPQGGEIYTTLKMVQDELNDLVEEMLSDKCQYQISVADDPED